MRMDLANRKNAEHGLATRNKIYQYLIDYITEYGYAPTIREICSALNIYSTQTVFVQLERLEGMHKIERHKHCPRAIKVIGMENIAKIQSDKLKKELYENCAEELKGIFTPEQLNQFQQVYYSVMDKYILSPKEK